MYHGVQAPTIVFTHSLFYFSALTAEAWTSLECPEVKSLV